MGLNQPQLAASVGKPNAFGKAEDFFICESLDCQFLSTPPSPPRRTTPVVSKITASDSQGIKVGDARSRRGSPET
ncbi:hypothetical protein CTAM01_03981 [Colletotrichum tamarilloi]|uniref:Uncharacterized protein n=1 Tax=Colletotrichum tamarilloi TaxID=1209934 RepID=A0ABQ9RJ35_9PEZI|nr:uncharacterized protein CTAM01_03981 [Colletotrichum tamarilloi]KAK1504674.1 hypothetical protein CTAM01_03981 [Colletotrichum tamarilloi]